MNLMRNLLMKKKKNYLMMIEYYIYCLYINNIYNTLIYIYIYLYNLNKEQENFYNICETIYTKKL